jgi:hypothetical protein
MSFMTRLIVSLFLYARVEFYNITLKYFDLETSIVIKKKLHKSFCNFKVHMYTPVLLYPTITHEFWFSFSKLLKHSIQCSENKVRILYVNNGDNK